MTRRARDIFFEEPKISPADRLEAAVLSNNHFKTEAIMCGYSRHFDVSTIQAILDKIPRNPETREEFEAHKTAELARLNEEKLRFDKNNPFWMLRDEMDIGGGYDGIIRTISRTKYFEFDPKFTYVAYELMRGIKFRILERDDFRRSLDKPVIETYRDYLSLSRSQASHTR